MQIDPPTGPDNPLSDPNDAPGRPSNYLIRLAPAALLVVLAACAEMSPPAPQPASEPVETTVNESQATRPTAPVGETELDARTLYQLLMSEIAAQRGLLPDAFAVEMDLARRTRDPRLAHRATEFAFAARQIGSAAESARLWIELDPGSDEARTTYVTLLVISGRLDLAKPLLAQAIANTKSPGPALLQSAAMLARAPNRREAYEVMAELARPYPQLPEAYLAIAQAAQGAGDAVGVVDAARGAARLDLNSPPLVLLTAQYLQENAPKDAEAVLLAYLKREPKSDEVRTAYARFLIGQKRYDQAQVQFQILLKAHPDEPETLYALGLLSYQAEHRRESEAYFKRFIARRGGRDPVESEDDQGDGEHASDAAPNERTVGNAYLYLAQIAEDRKDYAEALNYLGRIDDVQNLLAARARRAVILSHQGKLEQALTELRDYKAHSPHEHVQIVLTAAQLLRDANRSQDAMNLLNETLQHQPDDPDLLYDIGMTAEKLDRVDLMETTLRHLMTLQPENAQAYNALGYTFADRNMRLDEARELIEKANALTPDDASIVDSLGWVEYRLGNPEAALVHLRHAYQLRNDPEIGAHLGEVLWVGGHRQEAEKFWREAVHKEPDNQMLRATLARFNVHLGAL